MITLELVASFVALTLLTLGILFLKSYNDGHIRSWLDERQSARARKNGQMEDIGEDLQEIKEEVYSVKDTAEMTQQEVRDVKRTQERMGEIMVQLHEDEEEVQGAELREQLDVDRMPGDIWRGSSASSTED